ncbi:MAG TPA: PPA1309 family protein [Actinocrinis sp.]|nr:PPA1309 family protein [Actinocrinis sp.]
MSAALTQALIELEQHVAKEGWDQEPRLFALVDTAELIAAEPRLAAALAPETVALDGRIGPLRAYTSIEQEGFPGGKPLDEALAALAWPGTVHGAALVLERIMLPPSVEEQLPADGDGVDLDAWVAAHPERQEVRIAVGVLRDGSRDCALRLRAKDSDDNVLSGPDLVPGLVRALAQTLHD